MNLFTRLHLHYWRYLLVSPAFPVNSIPFSWCILTTGWFYECWHDFIFNSFISFSNTVCWHYSLDTLFTYFIQYQISQGEAVFLRVNYWAGLPHIHLDDKVRRFSLNPQNVVRNRPNKCSGGDSIKQYHKVVRLTVRCRDVTSDTNCTVVSKCQASTRMEEQLCRGICSPAPGPACNPCLEKQSAKNLLLSLGKKCEVNKWKWQYLDVKWSLRTLYLIV